MPGGDWIDRATQRLLVPIREALKGQGHGAQARLAREIGIDPSLLSKWLAGTRPRVDIETIETVAEYFEMGAGEVFDGSTLEPALKTAEEQEVVLKDMNATPEERKEWLKHTATYHHHRVTAAFIQAFLMGLRSRGTKR